MRSKLLTPEEVIDYLQLADDGCDDRTARERLRNRLRTRQIPHIKIGRLIRFRESDIEHLLEKQTVAAVAR